MATEQERDGRGRPSLVRRIEELIVRERLLSRESRVLVMVSGGQDSVALLHVLARELAPAVRPSSLHVLHVNHHLRGEDSDADEALVNRLCARLEVGLTVRHEVIDKGAGNLQEAARDARREAALATAAREECQRIALGHTADDQVETMLYRLGRYGGLSAFRAMLPCDPPWVRPLLAGRRQETAAYCTARGLEFAADRGNTYPGYARTGIRERVLPAWEAALPGAVEAAERAAEVAGEIDRVLSGFLEEPTEWVKVDSATLSAGRLARLEAPLRRLILHRWLEDHAPAAASRAGVLAVEGLLSAHGSARRALAGGWWACKEYDAVRLFEGSSSRLRTPVERAGPVPLSVPGEAEWEGVRIKAEPVAGFAAPDPALEAYVDVRIVSGPLWVRGPQPGDRLRPLGSPGTRKLQDVLVDLRVPAGMRSRTPLVVCDDRIVWVCGLVIAEEGRIARDTTSMVRLSVVHRREPE